MIIKKIKIIKIIKIIKRALCLSSALWLLSFNLSSNAQQPIKVKNIDDDYKLLEKIEKTKQVEVAKTKVLDPVAQEFSDRVSKINSYSAEFEQSEASLNNNKNNQITRVIKGKLSLSRPNKFLWFIASPSTEKQSYITNGEKLWHYDVGLEQVVIDKFDLRKIAHSPFYILLDSVENINKNYFIEKTGANSFKLAMKTKPAVTAPVTGQQSILTTDKNIDKKNEMTEQELTDLVDISNPNAPKKLTEDRKIKKSKELNVKDSKNIKDQQDKSDIDKANASISTDTNTEGLSNKNNNYITDLQVFFEGPSLIITKITFTAGGSKKITVQLNKVVVNPRLNKQMFNFSPPKGVDVITASELG